MVTTQCDGLSFKVHELIESLVVFMDFTLNCGSRTRSHMLFNTFSSPKNLLRTHCHDISMEGLILILGISSYSIIVVPVIISISISIYNLF